MRGVVCVGLVLSYVKSLTGPRVRDVRQSLLWDSGSVCKSLGSSRGEVATGNLRVQWESQEGILRLSQEISKDKTSVYRDYLVNYL